MGKKTPEMKEMPEDKNSFEGKNNGAMQDLFTQKSLAQINGPEAMNDYVRVTSPSVWIALTAIALLVLGLLGWSIFGTLAVHEADGTVREVRPITFIIN